MDQQEESRKKLLAGVHTLAVVCNQWGDTGKGKFVDYFADWADIIARGTGGANAGHTIRCGQREYVFHLVPSGILYDTEGKINIIGSGTVFDPAVVCSELKILENEGLSYKNLLFSKNAKLVLPQHLLLDRIKESDIKGKIGTTGRGIGPAYTDHYARTGLILNDILNPISFKEKLEKNLVDKIKFLKLFDTQIIKDIMGHEHLGGGKFYSEEYIFNIDAIVESYSEYGKILGNMITDTDEFLRESLGKKNILLEGAQGNLLSIDIGTYPYVTSSDCSILGLAKGVGLKESDVDLTLGIIKAPYMTRVGEGPFPTELGGEKSARWCGGKGVNKKLEKEKYPNTSIDSEDEFEKGIAFRVAGDEYGATTGRPRRTGWLDLPLLRYSMKWSGHHAIFTKLDVLDQCQTIRICNAYEYTGGDYRIGNKILKKGDIIKTAIVDKEIISFCKPIYTDMPGWKTHTSDITSFENLPKELKDVLDFISKETGIIANIISLGPDRKQTIINS